MDPKIKTAIQAKMKAQSVRTTFNISRDLVETMKHICDRYKFKRKEIISMAVNIIYEQDPFEEILDDVLQYEKTTAHSKDRSTYVTDHDALKKLTELSETYKIHRDSLLQYGIFLFVDAVREADEERSKEIVLVARFIKEVKPLVDELESQLHVLTEEMSNWTLEDEFSHGLVRIFSGFDMVSDCVNDVLVESNEE